jgi:hypothetical protein
MVMVELAVEHLVIAEAQEIMEAQIVQLLEATVEAAKTVVEQVELAEPVQPREPTDRLQEEVEAEKAETIIQPQVAEQDEL